jgi:hypothetical protein
MASYLKKKKRKMVEKEIQDLHISPITVLTLITNCGRKCLYRRPEEQWRVFCTKVEEIKSQSRQIE